MDGEIVAPEPAQELGPVLQKAEEYVRESKAPNTRGAYREDWEHFCGWCLAHRVESLPATPEVVAVYIADLADVCGGREVSEWRSKSEAPAGFIM